MSRNRRTATIAGVVATVLVIAIVVALVRPNGSNPSTGASAAPTKEEKAMLAKAVPAPRTDVTPQFSDGYEHFIVTVGGNRDSVGPDGSLGRWVELDSVRVPGEMLPYVAQLEVDSAGTTWVRLSEDAPDDLLPPAGIEALKKLPDTTLTRIDDNTYGVKTKASKDEVRETRGVAGVEDDGLLVFAAPTNDPYSYLQWALENRGDRYIESPGDHTAGADANVMPAWQRTRGGGVVVAVTDTRQDFSHPDLAPALWTNADEVCGSSVDHDGNGYAGDCHGYDFGYGNAITMTQPNPNQTHGSHVAGTIAAVANNNLGVAGVAPDVKIMPLAIGNDNNGIPFSAAAAAIRYAADNGASVINASWGGSYSQVVADAVKYAESKGVVFVAAAGNASTDITSGSFYPAALTYSNVITVGASTARDTMASFSNYSASRVHVFAPGWYIASTIPVNAGSYSYMSGTSMAAPHVAAQVAMLRSLDPTLTPGEIRDIVMQTSVRVPALAGRAQAGRIDVAASVEAVAKVASPAKVNFDGFDALRETKPQTPSLEVTADQATAGAHPSVDLKLGLAARVNGTAYAVADYSFTMTLPDGSTVPVTTDGDGVATVDDVAAATLVDGGVFDLDVDLPAGMYAMGVQVLDNGTPIGEVQRVVFEVLDASVPLPTTTTTTTTVAPPVTNPPDTPGTNPPVTNPPVNPPATNPPGSNNPPATNPPGSNNPPATNPPGTNNPPATNPPGTNNPPATNPPGSNEPPATNPPVTNPPGSNEPPATNQPPATSPNEDPTTTTTVPLPPPPESPRDLVGTVARGTVDLHWREPRGDVPTGYRVYRDNELIAQTSSTSVTVGDLDDGRSYEFQVSAYSEFGESARTAPLVITPPAAPTTTVVEPETPTPTQPPVTSAPPTVPDTVPPTTVPTVVDEGAYVISPSAGSANGGTMITVHGPDVSINTGVEIDGAFAQVRMAGTGWLIALTSPHAESGTYDVVLHFDGRSVVIPKAFTYTGGTTPTTAPDTPDTTPETTPDTTPDTTPSTNPPVTNPPPPTNPPVTNQPPVNPPVTNPPVTNPPVTNPPVTNPPPTNPPVTNPPTPPQLGTLKLVAVGSNNPVSGLPASQWDAMVCRSARCAG